ncbi:AbrB family transcriptional regulator [Marinobacter sp. JSM 1782161]|uniref:AbrB family transcriptional regulator n=1 Tax=Marinobacter sp. JSM 1782161 TaxID=2685906 RepID=UPI0014033E78|nr:AbrB family transcriptional regulator [Marinobacter sp. JSM 1782161]
MSAALKGRIADGGRLLPTLAVGVCGGGLAYAAGLPLPWLLGALIVTTLLSLAGRALPAPKASRRLVLVVIGVLLGGAFTPEMATDVGRWAASMTIMLLGTAVMMAVSVWLLRRVGGHSMDTAIYAGMPGGVSTVTLMAADSNADLRVVGLTHAVRILVLLLAIPPLLQLIGHVSLQTPTATVARWFAMPAPVDAAMLVGAGVFGAWLGRLVRLPNPLLFGPVLVSGALHITGVCEATIPPFIVALAQVVIGVSIGVRFAGTSLASVGFTLVLALLQAFLLILLAVGAAWLAHAVTGYSPAAALLAYMPGGAPELSLVALSLGIEPAFVTSHHLLRLTVLILLMPVLLTKLRRRCA